MAARRIVPGHASLRPVKVGNAPSLTVDALRGEMATHRRGSRPSQWPVRDLLGQQRSRIGELWDPRVAAAVSGLLACGAAVSVAFTVSDGAAPSRPDVLAPAPAAPVPSAVVPAPAPGPVVPAPTPGPSGGRAAVPDPAAPVPASDPAPRAWRVPATEHPDPVVPRPAAVPERRRGMSVQEITERLTAEVSAVEDGRVAGVLVVPIQREADATALADLARHPTAVKERASGRHRASTSEEADGDNDAADDDSDRDDSDRDDADDEHHDEDRASDADRDEHEDREDCDENHDDEQDDEHDDKHRDTHRDEDDDRDTADDTWPAHRWFGHDEKQVEPAAHSAHAAPHRPAMAILVTDADDDHGLTTRHIDTRAVLAALADLESADGDDGPYALGA
jgi:hypothetical protein